MPWAQGLAWSTHDEADQSTLSAWSWNLNQQEVSQLAVKLPGAPRPSARWLGLGAIKAFWLQHIAAIRKSRLPFPCSWGREQILQPSSKTHPTERRQQLNLYLPSSCLSHDRRSYEKASCCETRLWYGHLDQRLACNTARYNSFCFFLPDLTNNEEHVAHESDREVP